MKSTLANILLAAFATPVVMAVTSDDGLKIGSSNTVASGSNSIAAGASNTATNASVAIGTHNTTDQYALALGDENTVEGWGSAAFGSSNSIIDTNIYCLITGEYSNLAGSESSTLLGYYNNIGNEVGSLIAGGGNGMYATGSLTGFGNIILGENNNMYKTTSDPSGYAIQGSILIGAGNETSQPMAIAIGQANIAQTNSVTVGRFNAATTNSVFVVGNGTSGSGRSNALVVLNNGTVQIPSGNLQLGSESALTPTSAGTYLTSHNYLTRSYGTSSSLTSGALLAIGGSASANGTNAVAIGQDSSATSYAIALGDYASANGGSSVALGYGSNAWGSGAMAMGNISYALGNNSIAIGTNTFSNGLESLALAGGTANADNSFAATYGIADGYASIGMAGATASKTSSIAIGGLDTVTVQANLASGDNSAAIGGYLATASGDYSFTSGYQTKSTAAYSAVLGSNNLSASGTVLTPAHSYGWIGTEALFELGNGTPGSSPAEYSNAITTLKNGRTTLTNKFWSNTSPEDVPATTGSSDGEALVVEGHTVLKGNTKLSGKVTMDEPQGDISMGIYE